MERKYGDPINLPRERIYRINQAYTSIASNEFGIKITPRTPDHVIEARQDCALTFLEEGILPLTRNSIQTPSAEEVINTAQNFITQFKIEHPQDFDITEEIDLIGQAFGLLSRLTNHYRGDSNRALEDGLEMNLLIKTLQILDTAQDYYLDNFDE